MKYKIAAALLSLFLADSIHAQNELVFSNIFSDGEVHLHNGDHVTMRFKVQDTSSYIYDVTIGDVTVDGVIDEILDSSIILSAKTKIFERATVEVPLSSIIAFRKFSVARPALKAGISIVSAAATLLVTSQVAQSDEVFSVQNAALSAGTGATIYLTQQLFGDKMKYYTLEGWRPQIIQQQKNQSR